MEAKLRENFRAIIGLSFAAVVVKRKTKQRPDI